MAESRGLGDVYKRQFLRRYNTSKAGKEAADQRKAEEEKRAKEEAAAQEAAGNALKALEDKKGDVTDQEIKNAEEAINKVTDDAKNKELNDRLDKVKKAKEEVDKKKTEEENAFLDKISDFSFGKDEFDYAKMFFDKDSTCLLYTSDAADDSTEV